MSSYLQKAEDKLGLSPETDAKIMDAGKTGVAVGLAVGAYTAFREPNGAFVIPALQAGAVGFTSQYLLGHKGDMFTAAGAGAAQFAACRFIEDMPQSRCMEFSMITALLAYGAVAYIRPQLYGS